MTTTPRLGMTQLVSGQAVPETTVNENDFILEFFASGTFKSRATTAQPASPTSGDGYLLPASPTGTNWSGQGGKIALYINTAWKFFTAKEGMKFWVNDEDVLIGFDGTNWVTLASGTGVYSDENARDAIGTALVGGNGLTKTVDDAGNTITLDWDGGAVSVGTPADGDVLTYDGTNSQWVSAPFGGAGGGGTVPDGGTTGQVLTKDSGVDQDVSWQDPATLGSSTAPTIRGSNIGTTTGTTVAITLPAGSAAGDTAIILAISGNPVYPPSGTELIDEVSDSTSNFAVYTRVLDAADISTGSLTVTTATAFFMVATIVVIQGAVGHVEMNKRLMQIGAKPTPFQNRKIRSNIFFTNDLCLLSLSCRGSASTNTSDLGTLQQTSANSNGSQAVYSIPVASDGAIVPTVNIPNTGSFDMRVMFVTVRGA